MVETDVLRRSVRVDRISRNVGDWNHLLDMSLGQGGTYELLTFDRAGMVPRTATGRMLLMHANQGGGSCHRMQAYAVQAAAEQIVAPPSWRSASPRY
ncbi:MAG: hypothetical protein JNJ46_21220 [Myxococcales bacterium]|nr:hypothetical protein [Myxococcales bacterium]